MYIYKFSPRDFSEPVYKYIQGQTVVVVVVVVVTFI